MSNDPSTAATVLLTPCTGVCRLDEHGYCVGCRRTGEEIGRWRVMNDAERLYVMREILPARKGDVLS